MVVMILRMVKNLMGLPWRTSAKSSRDRRKRQWHWIKLGEGRKRAFMVATRKMMSFLRHRRIKMNKNKLSSFRKLKEGKCRDICKASIIRWHNQSLKTIWQGMLLIRLKMMGRIDQIMIFIQKVITALLNPRIGSKLETSFLMITLESQNQVGQEAEWTPSMPLNSMPVKQWMTQDCWGIWSRRIHQSCPPCYMSSRKQRRQSKQSWGQL